MEYILTGITDVITAAATCFSTFMSAWYFQIAAAFFIISIASAFLFGLIGRGGSRKRGRR